MYILLNPWKLIPLQNGGGFYAIIGGTGVVEKKQELLLDSIIACFSYMLWFGAYQTGLAWNKISGGKSLF